MIELADCQIIRKIHDGSNSIVYQATLDPDQCPVIVKVLQEDYPTPEQLTRYKQEYDITRSFQSEGVIQAYDLRKYQNTFAIILEDFGGQSLDRLIKQHPLPLDDFLTLAIKITAVLADVHAAKIIHKDINPSNLVFNAQTGALKIIDFGLSTVFSRENPQLKNPNVLAGTLAYISPEQTGRMNRSLDYTTDFYSLGVTFYEMLTGQLPFTTADPLALVHCHLAKQPRPPHHLNPTIPEILSEIVMKLLSKTTENRYQSALGLKADLENCLNQWQMTNAIDHFELAQQDGLARFKIPEKLYGRSQEIETLLTAFDRVMGGSDAAPSAQNQVEMVLVSGYSGTGKSVLVQELYKPITAQRGYFIAGKFEQFQRNIPYSAISTAFNDLVVQQILTENQVALDQWREKLQSALGANGQIIIDVIPAVAQILGPQPSIPTLDPAEAQNRFNRVFQTFIRVFSQPTHPLVLFLDDLQWADAASLKVIELLLADEKLSNMLLLGAYRDNEVDVSHPLHIILDRVKTSNISLTSIVLTALTQGHVSQLVADTLNTTVAEIEPLADLVYRKTSGNPFFSHEFLKVLYQELYLQFNYSRRSWQWDLAAIDDLDITENVVDLLVNKLTKIPTPVQTLLKLSACIGNRFDLATLSALLGKTLAETYTNLIPAIQSELIQPTSVLATTSADLVEASLIISNYRFLHDRVQQAAYDLIPPHEKEVIHLKIGQMMLTQRGSALEDDQLFILVDHLNKGTRLIERIEERTELADLNLEVGVRAKESAAYAAASDYLKMAMAITSDDIWTERYEFAKTLYRELAQAEYLNNAFDSSRALITSAIEHTNSALEHAAFYDLLVGQLSVQGQYLEAIQVGKTALLELGEDLPEQDFFQALESEIMKFHDYLGTRDVNTLLNNSKMLDPVKRSTLDLLIKLQTPTYLGGSDLVGIVMAKSANLSAEYGHTEKSAISYGIFGMLRAMLGDYELSYELTSLGYTLSKNANDAYALSQTSNYLANFSSPWNKPIQATESLNEESILTGLQSGMFQFAGFSMTHRLLNRIYGGYALTSLPQEALDSLHFVQKTQNQWSVDCILGQAMVLDNLLGRTADRFSFSCQDLNESQYLHTEACRTQNAICYYYIAKAQVLYLYNELSLAREIMDKAKGLLGFAAGTIELTTCNFYDSLILTALYTTQSASEQAEVWTQLQTNQQQMNQWAELCPENFLHKFQLVAAEMARISGDWQTAMDLYDLALAGAEEQAFLQEVALANELAGRFWQSRGKDNFAQLYFKNAYQAYRLWGAVRKVELLEEAYPQWLLVNESGQKTISKVITTTSQGSTESLDLATIMKVSQTLSSEIVLERLLEKILRSVIENAGAQLGYLLLKQGEGWFIEAEGRVESDTVQVLQSASIDLPDESSATPVLSAAIVRSVARTQESVILKNASQDGPFTRDSYVLFAQPKSLLCIPLVNQSKLHGILYLENNLVADAFTPTRVEILRLLASQAAISIESARLYEQLGDYNKTLKQQVAARTQELSHALDALKSTQADLVIENELLRDTNAVSTYDYQVGGSLASDAPTYVVRQADRQLFKALLQRQYCYIFNARQMGKSSLRVQMVKRMHAEGACCATLDLSGIGTRNTTPDTWYSAIIYSLASSLGLLNCFNVRTWLQDHLFLPPIQRLNEFMTQIVLTELTENVMIFIDEVDSVIGLDFEADDFFIWIRSCFNQRAHDTQFRRLSFTLLGVAAPSQLISDKLRTPFNIGQAIELNGFQLHEAHPLLQGLSDKVANPRQVLQQILSWTNGQPFLSQKICKLVCNAAEVIPEGTEQAWVDQLVRSQLIENWETKDNPEHFRTIRDRLLVDVSSAKQKLEIYQQLLTSCSMPVDSTTEQTELLLSGLVSRQGNTLAVANRLYASIFSPSWVKQTLDDLKPC